MEKTLNKLLINSDKKLTKQFHKRNDLMSGLVYYPLSSYLDFYYNVSFRNAERLNDLKDKGFVALPNHQSAFDIVLESMLFKRNLKKYAYYVMMSTLPDWLGYVGGISIVKGSHVRSIIKDADIKEKQRMLKEAKERREYVDKRLSELLNDKEIIVVHTEGKRRYKMPFEINISNIRRLLKLQEMVGRPLSFLPLNIKYEDKSKYRSNIEVIVGSTIEVENNGLDRLIYHLREEIV